MSKDIVYYEPDEIKDGYKTIFESFENILNKLIKTCAEPRFTTIRREYEHTTGKQLR